MSSTINADTTNGVVVTSDTSGEIELQSNGVTKAKVTANGLQDANGNSVRGGMYRNLIINGDMQIAQRSTSVAGVTANGYYTVDRFTLFATTAGTWTQTQDTDVPTGQGFSKSFKMQCTTANASLSSTSVFFVRQRIEAQNLQHIKKGTASAESLTYSFWVKSNKTGTYIAEIFDDDNVRQISKAYTINAADTWEKKVITFAGDTSGSLPDDNGSGFSVALWFVAGTNYTSNGTLNTSWQSTNTTQRAVGQVNLADSTSNYINITGVQLEVGSGASDFEFLPYDVQLARCQRYYERTGTGANFGSNLCVAQNTTRANCACAFPVSKRASPTISVYSSTGVNTVVAPGVSSVTVTVDSHNVYGIQFLGGAFVANRPYIFYYIADSEL